MKKYLAGIKNNVEIFDLKLTYQELEKAKEFLGKLGAEGRTILFIGTKVEANDAIKKAAKELNMPYVIERWLGGILTNYKALKGRVDYLISQKQKKAAGELAKYTKKEQSLMDKEMTKMSRFLEGLEVSKEMPAALVVVDPKKEAIAIKEAKRNKIPVVAIANSDCNPQLVDYVIPANDASVTSIGYILEELSKAYRRI
jgi:small subunit ribosomal protein S2